MRGITRCLELRGDLKDIQQYLQMVDRKLCLHTEKAKDVERMDGLVGCPMEAMGESHVSCKFLSLFLGFLFFDCLPSLYSQNGTRMLFMFCRQGLPTLFQLFCYSKKMTSIYLCFLEFTQYQSYNNAVLYKVKICLCINEKIYQSKNWPYQGLCNRFESSHMSGCNIYGLQRRLPFWKGCTIFEIASISKYGYNQIS